ncbi:uncharacterized protein PV06_11242 [Exophiala oligosperma]|uniref:Uncharacterized protein n=1 Tax=Exophiala oligosperma TaxID=215243 RepID=A0A0D2BE87_9EURO|nr:uncharacterized protein PV06_11852 [Exophiala oligosperma]XP_016256748.1 uncharacterized protein PV06_11242 [Exophiala oligosperma]KIW35817.1 hypothetical protein PV06_11852 [Exophiala oligosperma]KIW36532.1 hypothetical protein PV06_11242 [Exophiala oligosperma]
MTAPTKDPAWLWSVVNVFVTMLFLVAAWTSLALRHTRPKLFFLNASCQTVLAITLVIVIAERPPELVNINYIVARVALFSLSFLEAGEVYSLIESSTLLDLTVVRGVTLLSSIIAVSLFVSSLVLGQNTFTSSLLFTLTISLCCLYRIVWVGKLLRLTGHTNSPLSYNLGRSIVSIIINFAAFGLEQRFSQQETLWLTIQLLVNNTLLALRGIQQLYIDHVGNISSVRRSSSREQIVSKEHTGANSTATFATMNERTDDQDQAPAPSI